MRRFFIISAGMLSFFLAVSAQAQTVQKDKKVKFDYTLKVEDQVVESSEGKMPLEYVHGTNQIIPGLEKELEGLKVGDTKSVTVSPKDGYGEVSEAGFREIPKSTFPKDFEPQQGMVIELEGPEKQMVPAVIWEIKDENVVLNFNHPLAGKTLQFDVKIVSIE